MSDLLLHPKREPLQASYSDEDNPLGLDGIEFVEYTTGRPQALGQVLQMMGFHPVARHRSREVLLYRQGALNIVVNAHPVAEGAVADEAAPVLGALALRVRDAQAAYQYALDQGAWAAPTHPRAMELNIPAIHGVGGSRIHFVDRYREFSIYNVDFVPIPSPGPLPPVVPGLHFFGVVQYVGVGRLHDWIEFYGELFGTRLIPDDMRFGILPAGKLLQAPALAGGHGFMLQLVEPPIDQADGGRERLQRIGLGVPDVFAAVRALRERGVEFVETDAAHTERRGAITRTYLGGIVFELVHSEAAAPEAGEPS